MMKCPSKEIGKRIPLQAQVCFVLKTRIGSQEEQGCETLKIIIQAMFVSNFHVFVCHQESWSTENTFRSTENTFQLKKNLVWFSGKCFLFWLCLFSGKWFSGNHFPNFPVFVCHQKSWSTENTFQLKKNLAWFSGKCFPGKFERKTLSGSCEKFRNVIIC